ncbi:MAG: hypothetical protein QNJ40_12105 [Xanthomonadales bacterium]|nr:hypothetical protein [Xanthomonadales bacterium]
MTKVLRSIGAPILGYATIVIGALIFQDALFGRVTHESSLTAIVVGGGLTVFACVVAGYVLAQIAPTSPVLHAVPLVVWLGIETTILHLEGNSPLWFDAMAGGSNVLGVILGVYIWIRHKHGAHTFRIPSDA